jgi:hypothetical protein
MKPVFPDTELHQAIVQPFSRPMHPKFNGGLVLPAEGPLQALRHHRWNRPIDHPPSTMAQAAPVHRLAGTYRYGGPLMLPFGHFMAESIHRLMPVHPGDADIPVVFAGLRRGDDASSLPVFAKEVLGLLTVDAARVQIVTAPTAVERLLVRAQGSNLGGGPAPAYLDLLDRLSAWCADGMGSGSPRKLYVSRSAQVTGCLLGERVLEAAMVANGFTVFRPEQHPVARQMRAYAQAEVVVFAEGSACHGVELMGRALPTVVLLNRRRGRTMDMFEVLLRPRARRYLDFRRNIYLGALPANRTGKPQPHQGVSVLALQPLVAFMREHGIADLSELRQGDYAAAVRADLERYTRWALDQGYGDADSMRALAHELAKAVDAALAGFEQADEQQGQQDD